jgi:hypothetical protein
LRGSFYNKLYVHAGRSEHVHECVEAEQVDTSPYEVTNARLGHSEKLRSGSLCETTAFDELSDMDHEFRAEPEVLGLLIVEPEISKDVAG